MNQRPSLADTFGHIRRDLLQLDDIDRECRCVHRDAEDVEELDRPVQSLDFGSGIQSSTATGKACALPAMTKR